MTPILVIFTICVFLGIDYLLHYHKQKVKAPAPDAIYTHGLGWSLADGGEKIEEKGNVKPS